MTKININVQKIAQAAQQAHKEVAIAIHLRSIQVISTPGYFDSTPNDIVDTGLLRASQQFPSLEGNAYILRNNVEYGPYVYFGYQRSNGARVEGRPWMQAAADEVRPQELFTARMKELLA